MTDETEKTPMMTNEYRKANMAKADDWTKTFIREQAYDEETLPEDSKKKPKIRANKDSLIALARINGQNVDKLVDGASNTGQLVMSITNMLRKVAKQRFGLVNLDDEFCEIDQDDVLIADVSGPTHDEEGAKIEAAKAA